MLSKMDDDLFSSCLAKYKDKEEKHASLEAKHKLTWEKLESAAAFQSVTGHTAILVGHQP
jgi:serine/threonine-protein phosphatase 2A regulatory subunit B'